MRFVEFSVVVGALLAAFTPGLAQTPSGDAEQLFRDGKRLMDEGNVADACVAFDGSYRKDPAVTTLLNLANCREANRQFASAWGHFIEAARLTRGQPALATLNQTAVDRAARLEPRLSYLIINVHADVQVEGLSVTRNGAVVDASEWNRAIPVDGGEYAIEAKAPAHEPWSTVVKVGNAKDKQSVDVPRFQPLPDRPDSPTRDRWHHDRIGWALAGSGAIGMAVGAGFLLSAADLYDQADGEDQGSVAMRLEERARTRAIAGGIIGGVGVAVVAAGVIKLALHGDAATRDVSVKVTLMPSGAIIWGSF